MSEPEVWLTTRAFVAYWQEHTPPAGIWAITEESAQSEPGEGLSLAGLFVSPLAALSYLAVDELGPEITARLTWLHGPRHDGYWDIYGRDDTPLQRERFYKLVREDVATKVDQKAIAAAVALSPEHDPYADDEQ